MKMEDLLPAVTEALSQNKTFTLPVTGTSMLPLLHQGQDTVELSAVTKKDGELSLKIGDLPLYRRKNGDFVLHRVVKIEGNTYTMCGDNQFETEKGIEDYQIIGVVSSINQNGRKIRVTDTEYVSYVKKTVKNVSYRYPLRRLRKKASDKIRKNKAVKTAVTDTGANIGEIKTDILENGEKLIAVLRFIVSGDGVGDVSEWNFGKIKKISDAHRVSGFLGQGILNIQGVPDEVKASFKKELFRTASRYTNQQKEEKALSEGFNRSGINHCFLKGTKVAGYYDVPDSRFMLDMDIYVDNKRIGDATKVMLENGYEKSGEDTKDISFVKSNYLNVELHKELKYEYDDDYGYYKNAGEKLVKASDDGFELKMTNEDFYVYALSHTAHHFSVSGTGIRSVLDHWYLRKNLLPVCDKEKVKASLEGSGLLEFCEKMDELCDYWFCDGEKTDIIKEMSDYIILSGIYGNGKNTYINGVLKRGQEDNVTGFLLRRFFPDLRFMKKRYGFLNQFPFLLPVMWIVRIISSFSSAKSVKNEVAIAGKTQKSEIDKRNDFFGSVGL